MTIPGLRLRILALVLVASCTPGRAEVRRALLVGIDEYAQPADHPGYRLSAANRERLKAIQGTPSRRSLGKLDGAFNDAAAMKEILIQRFGFEERNVLVLPNPHQEASADNILQLLQSHLIDQAKPGDVSLFYFAGHGSRIRNRAAHNENSSGLDSTIVPADALLGVPDIRSKELARIYAQAAKKGVILTVIEDSCYSGGTFRGVTARKVRAEQADTDVSVDETFSGPLPEDEGVLVMSASQDYEPATELPQTDLGAAHGAFTWALLHVLGASPPDESVDRIFQRVRALIQSSVSFQEPVLLAKKGRSRRGLFGQPVRAYQALTIAAGRIAGPVIKLNGGLAMNLHAGCELKRVAPAGPPIELRITKVNGLASSDAIVSAKSAEPSPVHVGDLFELTKWVTPDQEQMRVFLGPPAPKAEIQRALTVLTALRSRASADWITDPAEQPPTHVLSWEAGRSRWSWKENRADAKTVWLERLSWEAISPLLAKAGIRPRVFAWIPPSADLVESLNLGGNIAIVKSPALADYVLLGRACVSARPQCVEHAWVLPDAPGNPESIDRPQRTDWVAVDDDESTASQALRRSALGLARILSWSRLRSPQGDDSWPYNLALQNTTTKRILDSRDVKGGECYKLLLRAAPGDPKRDVPIRRVYVFAVDSFGKATLLFGNNLANEFPRFDAAAAAVPETIPLTSGDCDLVIGEPYGTDNYFLLASAAPIDNPETMFNFDGVKTRGGAPASTDPLARLLQNAALGRRGPVTNIPVNWSIQHLRLLSWPPGDPK
jgi:hypothetical protein